MQNCFTFYTFSSVRQKKKKKNKKEEEKGNKEEDKEEKEEEGEEAEEEEEKEEKEEGTTTKKREKKKENGEEKIIAIFSESGRGCSCRQVRVGHGALVPFCNAEEPTWATETLCVYVCVFF